MVDDNPTNLRIIALQTRDWGMITRDHRIARRGARNGFGRRPFDLVILDLHMAGMNGLELAQEIRKLKNDAGQPMAATFRWSCCPRSGRASQAQTRWTGRLI